MAHQVYVQQAMEEWVGLNGNTKTALVMSDPHSSEVWQLVEGTYVVGTLFLPDKDVAWAQGPVGQFIGVRPSNLQIQ